MSQLAVPVCVVSNVDHDDLQAALDAHGLHVAHTVSSEQARAYKPHPDIFELALARTGWSRDRVLHVGDSLHSDVAGARGCGLKTAWIHRDDRIHDIGTAQADFCFTDLQGIANMFT